MKANNSIDSDRRNVTDAHRGMSVEDIKNDLDQKRIALEIAIENVERDFNMGTIVRTANAFNVKKIHIIGRRQWNKRGAMMTDKYMHLEYHATVQDFKSAVGDKQIVAVDNIDESEELARADLPADNVVLVFGSEASGISKELLRVSDYIVAIEQFGSTRSLNVGVAAGVVMYEWVRRNYLT